MITYSKSPVSIPQAARELGVCESSVRRWIRSGVLPAETVGPGRRYRIGFADLDELRHRVTPDR